MLKELQRIVLEVSSLATLADALSRAAVLVKDLFHVDAVSIFLLDTKKTDYVLVAESGLQEEWLGVKRYKLGKGLVGYIAQREVPVNLEQAGDHEFFQPLSKEAAYHFDSFLGVPIYDQGILLGIFAVESKKPGGFSEEEEAFLVTLSVQLGGHISRALSQGDVVFKDSKQKKKRKSLLLKGLPGASGVVVGKAVMIYPQADLLAVPDQTTADIDGEIDRLESALIAAKEELQQLKIRAQATLSAADSALFDAYVHMLDSRSLIGEIETEIQQGMTASSALRRVIQRHVLQFEAMDDPYLKERAADFRDLGHRILSHLQAMKQSEVVIPEKTILVSDEVTATSLIEMPEGAVIGIVSGKGSGNSHVSILARALGIPSVMSVTGVALSELAGQELIVDGYNGEVYVSPSGSLKKEYKQLITEENELDASLVSLWDQPAETLDGHQIQLLLNTGLASDGGIALSTGAEGVGLYRTELPFMQRSCFPTEEEQRIMYRQLLNTFSPRRVVMRTLDIGGDKNLSYFPISEENPFLGWRGIRISLDHPDIFLQQVRAMIRASEDLNNLCIMLPMITSISEVETGLQWIQQAFDEVVSEELNVVMPKIGLMIEVPAAVYRAYDLARRVDFLSVGSNDLIQYLLAVDRNNPRVASLYNGLHPAVLQALNQVVKAGRKANRPVGICGEMASDPLAVLLLLGMGFSTLSLNARSLSRVKWMIRQFDYSHAKSIAVDVLKMGDPVEITEYMSNLLENSGLGGLIRAGN